MRIKERYRVIVRASEKEKFDERIFNLAYAKAQRWARAAYGVADMEEMLAETEGSILCYYAECKAGIEHTFNRRAFNGNG